ncbi:unnamed protein product [Zymoseptoria tritici ST99CH_1E4]|nr:unnamed protein product [Zymoseptoria tritici ST99CH_1E4]
MDGIRKQIFANLRVACPSFTQYGNSTEIVVSRIDEGLFQACVCSGVYTNGAPGASIMGPGKHTTLEAMEGLLVMTCALVEARCAQSFAESTSESMAQVIAVGHVSKSAVQEALREY